jgi:putative protease
VNWRPGRCHRRLCQNCFNAHTAAELLLAVFGITTSELTIDELRQLAPWSGAGFEVLIYGRPEGMTIEHCVLSAAFDRQPMTCRDLCVKKHPLVSLADPAGYAFPLATDSDCRNRLLHSRPIEGSEFIPRLRDMGIRSYRAVFNVPDQPVAELVAAYRRHLGATSVSASDATGPRVIVGKEFTRGHFVRAV